MTNYEADEAKLWRAEARDQYEAPDASEYQEPEDEDKPVPFHKARPRGLGAAADVCVECGADIRKVPGGHGPTWVHDSTGCVAGGERKTYTLVITASLVSTSQQDAWDTWAELLHDPLFVENNTTVSVTA